MINFLMLVSAMLIAGASIYPFNLVHADGTALGGADIFGKSDPVVPYSITLSSEWKLQSSEKLNFPGNEISSTKFNTDTWYKLSVPSTVMAALLKNGEYKDLFFGENLKSVPNDRFEKSWWYRNEFELPFSAAGGNISLKLDGINYYANIWLNGKLAAGRDSIFGAFRQFELDITKFIKTGDKNVLAIEVFPPKPGDYTIGFVDWNPVPPDKNIGIFREVKILFSGDVSIRYPYVRSSFGMGDYSKAQLIVSAELKNNSQRKVTGILEGTIDSIVFQQEVELNPSETKLLTFSPSDFPQLNISSPRVWWTYDLGEQEFYNLKLSFKINNEISDSSTRRFAIREISDYLNEEGYRGYKLNGKKILIRGGGWVDNLFLDNTYKNLETQVKYARHMNLNTLRLEGFWGANEDLYNLCDEHGILLMAGWSCQWEWEPYIGKPSNEFGAITDAADRELLAQSWQDQIKWLRNHPSLFVWLYGSDKVPEPELEKEYLRILSESDPSRPYLSSAGDHVSSITGKSGVKMRGPYDYVPPSYWYTDTANGGAFGFNTETGPGPQIPVLESIKKFIPKDHLWPLDSVWNYHCGGFQFKDLGMYTEALNRKLGEARSLEEFVRKFQFLNYEGMRAMFEAFVVNKGKATGIIQWMYNAAWPKLWWQLYDYYLVPNAAFYGARKANSPYHIIYNYGTKEVVAVNSRFNDIKDLRAEVKVYNFDMEEKYSFNKSFDLPADTSFTITSLNNIENLTSTYFTDLRLYRDDGELYSSNFYCLSTKEDVLDYTRHQWYVTPQKQFADLKMLNDLPEAEIEVSFEVSNNENGNLVWVELKNPSKNPAHQIELTLINEQGESFIPVYWLDNYITLLPEETRNIGASFNSNDSNSSDLRLKVSGWNVKEKIVSLK